MFHLRRSLKRMRPLVVFSGYAFHLTNSTIGEQKRTPLTSTTLKTSSIQYTNVSEQKPIEINRYLIDIKNCVELLENSRRLLCGQVKQVVIDTPSGGTCVVESDSSYNSSLYKATYYTSDGELEYTQHIRYCVGDYGMTYVSILFPNEADYKHKYVVMLRDGKVKSIQEYVSVIHSYSGNYQGEYIEYARDDVVFYGEYYKSKLSKAHILIDSKGRDCIIKHGEIVVWKCCQTEDSKLVYVKLLVPATSRRQNKHVNDCACIVQHAKVLDIFDKNGVHYTSAYNYMYSNKIKYEVNKTVTADNYGVEDGGLYVFLYQDHCDRYVR